MSDFQDKLNELELSYQADLETKQLEKEKLELEIFEQKLNERTQLQHYKSELKIWKKYVDNNYLQLVNNGVAMGLVDEETVKAAKKLLNPNPKPCDYSDREYLIISILTISGNLTILLTAVYLVIFIDLVFSTYFMLMFLALITISSVLIAFSERFRTKLDNLGSVYIDKNIHIIHKLFFQKRSAKKAKRLLLVDFVKTKIALEHDH